MSNAMFYIKLHMGDYLRDTMRLTTLQHGGYYLLLLEYYSNGPLPNDDRALAAIARSPLKTWKKDIGPAIKPFFYVGDDGLMHQKRADAERSKAGHISKVRKTAAKGRANGQQTASKTAANEEQLHERLARVARDIDIDIDIDKDRDKKAREPPTPLEVVLPDWLPAEPWNAFVEHRRGMKRPLTEHGIKLLIGKLEAMHQLGADITATLEESVMSGWTGVFDHSSGGSSRRRAPPRQNRSQRIEARLRLVEDA